MEFLIYALCYSWHINRISSTPAEKQQLCDLESENRSAPIGASPVIEESFNKTERCIQYVKGLNQSVAFLSKKAVEFSPAFYFSVFPSQSD